MKKINKIFLVSGLSLLSLTTSCTLDEVGDLNGPSIETILKNSSRGDIQDLVGGVLSDMRVRMGTYYDNVGVIGREFYRFSSSDTRLTGDLLGKGGATLDDNTFYTTGPWSARYGTVKSANIILQAIPNTSPAYSNQELNAIKGFIKTIQAHELLLNLNLMYQNGVRIDTIDPANLGPFLNYTEALKEVAKLLDSAASDLLSGESFPFTLTEGFKDFNTPKTFREFNKALAARVAMYRGDSAGVLSALEESFLNINGNLNRGVFYNFSANGGDFLNPMFFQKNATAAGARIAHPTFISEAETDDKRLDKIIFRELVNDETGDLEPNPLTFDNLTGSYDVFVYESNTSSIPIIRNEELVLLYAEANMMISPSDAETAINRVRSAAGLDPVSPGSVDVDRILYERRYSLFTEGHRWVDMRRYNKLGDLPIDRAEDDVWEEFPIPATENK